MLHTCTYCKIPIITPGLFGGLLIFMEVVHFHGARRACQEFCIFYKIGWAYIWKGFSFLYLKILLEYLMLTAWSQIKTKIKIKMGIKII